MGGHAGRDKAWSAHLLMLLMRTQPLCCPASPPFHRAPAPPTTTASKPAAANPSPPYPNPIPDSPCTTPVPECAYAALYVRAVPVVEIRHTLFANQTSTLIGAAELLSLHDHATLHNTTFRNNSCNRNNANTGSSLYVAEYDGVTTNGQPDGPLFQLTLTNSTFEVGAQLARVDRRQAGVV